MEYTRAHPLPKLGTLVRRLSKILRFRRSITSSAIEAPSEDGYSLHKLKLSQSFNDYSTFSEGGSCDFYKVEYEKQQGKLSSKDKEAMEALLANLFASASAIKAAYAQLQMSQSPYDPDRIQSSDLAIVSELKRVSELKHSYIRSQFIPCPTSDSHSAVAAQIEEQRNLIKTYRITLNKLEADLKVKDAEIFSLQTELVESDKSKQALDSKLHPGRSLSALDDLHLSGLNPTHFLTAVRFTLKSIRSFVKVMAKEMESAGWNLDAVAGAMQPDFLHRKNPAHRSLAFQTYICQTMFSDFHHKSYNLSALEELSTWDRRQFFDEFSTEISCVGFRQKLNRHTATAKFCTAKYLALVHPKMESAFFGDLNHRDAVSSDRDFPHSAFFTEFAEMARRVWLLHCLFFCFEGRSIFQVRRGSRFSEVYMESVAEIDDLDAAAVAKLRPSTVGFTVVPGFKVGRMLIQCKVYLT
ncbi:hypothetical protein Cni_G16974 [Canna indica]|uniref:DUF641 domain-containing protein n=1 Tax=Canna indica TaxID=4628 RepID=A0AAQ3KLP3_9LILI|nr:hypothetical protein Cni_G16974 [Canna indica]